MLNEEIAESFFKRVLEPAKPYMSDEHFTVDGTLIEAGASHQSFRPKDGTGKPPGAGGDVDFRGEKRKNQTHESTTDPDAREVVRVNKTERQHFATVGEYRNLTANLLHHVVTTAVDVTNVGLWEM